MQPSSQTNPKLGDLGLPYRFGLSGKNPGIVSSEARTQYEEPIKNYAKTAKTVGRRTGKRANPHTDSGTLSKMAKLGS